MTQKTLKNRTIFCKDNLGILRGINTNTIDLIYLDPPFNKNKSFFAPIGSEAEGASFRDTWYEGDIKDEQLDLIVDKHPKIYKFIHGIEGIRNDSDKNYLVYMAVRLIEMHRVLKDTGSLYLHCDSTMSHFLKILLDCIFGWKNFQNNIVWCYKEQETATTYFPRKHDAILFYSKTENKFFQILWQPHTEAQLKRYNIINEDGSRWANMKGKLRPLGEGSKLRDYWNIDIAQGAERTGYPTQKPLALLERIIKASCPENGLVLDPFCGCATTCVVAEKLGCQWIGIDVSKKAFELLEARLAIIESELPDQKGKKELYFREDIPLRTDLGKIKKYNHPDNKKLLYGQQGGDCNGCGTHFENIHLEVDHIIAKNSGGADNIENLQLLCGHCNKTKGANSMEYLKAKINHKKKSIFKIAK